MPGATLPNMLITLPSLGGDEGIWDDEINAALSLVDAHDHTSNKGARITPAAMNINADLAFGGFFISAMGKLSFQSIAAPSTGSKALFVNSADNELYWRTNAGTNVKLTSGTSINTSLVGGIVGDYATVGAEVAYDDANDRYTFKQQGTKPWARMASGPVRIFEFNTLESVYVELIAPAALAASYTITLPLAPPASAKILQMSTTGVLTADNAIGAITVTGTIVATSTITGSDFNHTASRGLIMGASTAVDSHGSHTRAFGTSGAQKKWTIGASVNPLQFPIDIQGGGTITSYNLYVNKVTAAGLTISAKIYRVQTQGVSMGTETAVSAGVSNSTNAPGTLNLNESGLSITIAAGFAYYLVFTGSGNANDEVFSAEIGYTRP